MKNKVVITGMGVVTPIGTGLNTFWKNLITGKNGVREIKSFNTDGFRTNKGGEVIDFDENKDLGKNYLTMPRASKFSITAIREALSQSKIDVDYIKSKKVSVVVGTTMGEMQVIEDATEIYVKEGFDKIPNDLPKKYPCNVITNNISTFFDLNSFNILIPSACAAGNYAIGYGFDLIKTGKAEIVICGGVDPMSKIAFAGFNKLMACAPEYCSPFDADRKGMIVSEGAGFIILESESFAKSRGAKILSEIPGYGVSNDAYKSTIPHPEGKGGIIAVKKALFNSNIKESEIDYICAHGTGTVENDKVETLISKQIFGSRANSIPISSLKSMLGHTMGACAAIETIASVMMINEKIVAPTINYKNPDILCDLDYVPNVARKYDVKTILNNSYAFGGNNSSLIIREYRE
ncbi:MAG TPA: beta-ketoacyl-[acyl-carrier-protein] synthase family protein [Spirochaetota bacterium]|nr:beta-ketoacyl-[acyl-carrier-protein] synthase family protein [Spirochaetota bacterium]